MWHRLALILSQGGHEVHASLSESSHLSHPKFTELSQNGIRVTARAHSTTSRQLAKLTRRFGIFRFQRLLGSGDWDLVVVTLGAFHREVDAHLVSTVRDLGLPYVQILQQFSPYCYPGDVLRERLKKNYREARLNIFVSNASRREVRNFLSLDLENAMVAYNPCQHTGQLMEWPQAQMPVFACVGRIDFSHKGQDILLDVLSSDKWKRREWRLNFFGKGTNEVALRERIDFLKLSDKVKYMGQIEDVAAMWREHHCLVLPSRIEGTPLSIIEAAHFGRPCIATAVSGTPEIVVDNETGFLANALEERALDDALERSWQARDKWQSVGLTANSKIRGIMPQDPCIVLSDRINSMLR